MKRYLRIMLGAKSAFAKECYEGNFIGYDLGIEQDFSNDLPENWKEFNLKYIPIWLEKHPSKSKIAAGLACGGFWTIAKGLNIGDVVLCPNGGKGFYVGEVSSDYYYTESSSLPHRRAVKWYPAIVERSALSDTLQNSVGSMGTVSDISQYAEEIERLIGGDVQPVLISTDETVDDPIAFALEKHLEEFLIHNWKQTELGKEYDLEGQQYPVDTGRIDILAISKDKKILLVIELKKGRASDSVVGQILRYMGYVQEELAENHQKVKGIIIAHEDDPRIRRALSVTTNIEFYKYKVSFKLTKD